jgi:uncharacterized membrane protein
MLVSFAGAFKDIGIDLGNITNWNAQTFNVTSLISFDTIISLFQTLVVGIVLLFIVVVVAAYLARKSLTLTSDKSGVGMFGTAGTVLLIGAVLIIIVIGLIAIWIACLLIAIAFFTLKPRVSSQPAPPPQPPP